MTNTSEFTAKMAEAKGFTLDNPETVTVRSEPLTYDRHGPHSFFRDLALATINGDPVCQARLDRHAMELRVNPNTTDGTGGYFSPPAWLNQEFATANRAVRVLADLYPHFPLPKGVSQVSLPLMTTGTTVGAQNPDGAVPDGDVVDATHSPTLYVVEEFNSDEQ